MTAEQPTLSSPGWLAGEPSTEATHRHGNHVSKIVAALVIAIAGLSLTAWLMHFDRLAVRPHTLLPQPRLEGKHVALTVPGYAVVAQVTTYSDELFAYLMFQHLRQYPEFRGGKLLLTFDRQNTTEPYRLIYRADEDLLKAYAAAAVLKGSGTLTSGSVQLVPMSRVSGYEQETELFDSAYNLPVRRKLEQLPRTAVAKYLRRFIRFKSVTDPRIRRRLQPMPAPLSSIEAQQMAADILRIAEFYSLPLDFFLGIAAVENNYMNVRGDLQHSIWKRRAAPDDVVLESRKGRVRVLNDSAGVWQITRETLRYAHSLYKRDFRDYSLLPEHLRPPATLAVEDVSPQVLTTYAGLLLRDLLDRFEGDVTLAVSAYNGGPSRPNLRYGQHVHRAATHARRVV
ncbi:MAG TPA: hypothetical protein VES20_09495, partial [Bryobacteraceae bacterium]|nr:hypothetical protein [Bryobacteraceae bacterium]